MTQADKVIQPNRTPYLKTRLACDGIFLNRW